VIKDVQGSSALLDETHEITVDSRAKMKKALLSARNDVGVLAETHRRSQQVIDAAEDKLTILFDQTFPKGR